MPYEHLEHEGDEDFSDFAVRGELKRTPISLDNKTKLSEEEEREKQQAEYLSWDNPALWEGDIDD